MEPLCFSPIPRAVLLAAAANREDLLIPISDRLKGGAVGTVARALLKQRLAEEIVVASNSPHWRRNEEGMPVGLRITRTGLASIGIDPEDSLGEDQPSGNDANAAGADNNRAKSGAKTASSPRPGSKGDLAINLLCREAGANIGELTAATGWLPHTVRAAMTRLRQKGQKIERRAGADGARYAITEKPDAVGVVLDHASALAADKVGA